MARSRVDIAGANRNPERVSIGRATSAVAVSTVAGGAGLYAHYKAHFGERAADLPGLTDLIQESGAHAPFGSLVGVGIAYLATRFNRLQRSVEGLALTATSATGLNMAILEFGREGDLRLDWKMDTVAAVVGAVSSKWLIERPNNMPPLPTLPQVESVIIEPSNETI